MNQIITIHEYTITIQDNPRLYILEKNGEHIHTFADFTDVTQFIAQQKILEALT